MFKPPFLERSLRQRAHFDDNRQHRYDTRHPDMRSLAAFPETLTGFNFAQMMSEEVVTQKRRIEQLSQIRRRKSI